MSFNSFSVDNCCNFAQNHIQIHDGNHLWKNRACFFTICSSSSVFLASLFNPLLGRTRSRGRCWAAIRLSHPPEPSSRAVQWGGRWIGHSSTTWSLVCSFATHSQAAEEAVSHLYQQERKRPRPVQRRLSRIHAVLGRAIPRGGADVGDEITESRMCCPTTLYSIPPRAPHFCCCQMNWWFAVRRVQMGFSICDVVHLHSVDRWTLSGTDVQAPWHGVLETMWLLFDEAQQDNRCLLLALPVAVFLEMLTEPVATRGNTAIRAGCVQRVICRKTPFSRRGSISAAQVDPRLSMLQLNTEGLTTNKILMCWNM